MGKTVAPQSSTSSGGKTAVVEDAGPGSFDGETQGFVAGKKLDVHGRGCVRSSADPSAELFLACFIRHSSLECSQTLGVGNSVASVEQRVNCPCCSDLPQQWCEEVCSSYVPNIARCGHSSAIFLHPSLCM